MSKSESKLIDKFDEEEMKKYGFNSEELSDEDRNIINSINEIKQNRVIGVTAPQSNVTSDVLNPFYLVQQLTALNPSVEIQYGELGRENKIYTSVPAEELKLPEGFEYNGKNGITNKHHTATGQYICLDVEQLEETFEENASIGL